MSTEYILTSDGELYHWLGKGKAAKEHKYIKREWKNGRWQYWCDQAQLKSDINAGINNAVDKTATRIAAETNKAAGSLNDIVNKGKDLLSKFYDDPDNIYNVTHKSYAEKLEKVKETQEWKDIVARGDKEYVQKNKDGTVTYKIDDYIVNKKHPAIDAINDIIAGREVTVNEVTKDTVVAGLKDYATTAIEIGMMAVGLSARGLSNKFKFSQGSYDETIKDVAKTVEDGYNYVNDTYETASNMSKEDLAALVTTSAAKSLSDNKTASNSNTATRVYPDVDSDDITNLASILSTSVETARNIDEGNVVEAAKVIMESDVLKNQMGTNEYYRQAESALSNLSEEEIMLINILIQEMRK